MSLDGVGGYGDLLSRPSREKILVILVCNIIVVAEDLLIQEETQPGSEDHRKKNYSSQNTRYGPLLS